MRKASTGWAAQYSMVGIICIVVVIPRIGRSGRQLLPSNHIYSSREVFIT